MDNTGRKTHGKSKKIISRFLIGIVVVLLVIVVGAIALFWNELRTISSIRNRKQITVAKSGKSDKMKSC